LKDKKYISGISLPIAVILTFAGMGVVFSYYNSLFNEFWIIEYQIAETKASYMADTGIAESRQYMINQDFDVFCNAQESEEAYSKHSGTILSMEQTGLEMGNYSVQYCMDPETFAPRAISVGKATVKNVYGQLITIEKTKYITFSAGESLNDFLYLTGSERAGGAPFVWANNANPPSGNRREVNFGAGDNMNGNWPQGEPVCDVGFQTNGTFVISDFTPPCPSFKTTVTITQNEDGTYNDPDMGTCSEQQLFQGEPPLDTLKSICLSSDADFKIKRELIDNLNGGQTGYNGHLLLNATEKMKWVQSSIWRDTLIMTDIKFINDGGIEIKQWWYLIPPYLNKNACINGPQDCNGAFENPFVQAYHIGPLISTCEDEISLMTPIYQCNGLFEWGYGESVANFHAKNVNTLNGSESLMHFNVQEAWGLHHYDVPDIYNSDHNSPDWESQLNDEHLLKAYADNGGSIIYYFNKPTAIYVKGGNVRVHGKYKGRYTIMTDEKVSYHRHAQGSNFPPPSFPDIIDTLYTNIWIIDDLTNADAPSNGNLINHQPDKNCEGGSENILGLVSGANVYVANSSPNRSSINIHAHIIAYNESFAAHYFQNTTTNAGGMYSNPPFADGQGVDIYNGTGMGDFRGTINLWGGVVQKFRGYVQRNQSGGGNYVTNDIGYEKNYNFDCNLKCSDKPPLYPDKNEGSCNEQSEEKKYTVANYY